MKSLIRWGATLSLLGSTLLGTWFAQMPKVLALPEADIIEVLREVPVFTIITDEGMPLVGVRNDQQVTQIFMSQQDANQFLAKLKENRPEIGNQFKVQPLPLGEVHRFALANNKETQSLQFMYVPMQSAVESAKEVLRDKGQEYQGGVPLFVLQDGPDNDIIVLGQKEQPVIPFFFEKADSQALAEEMKKQQPDIAQSIKIGVVTLEGVINSLHTEDDVMLKNILLVPSHETMKFIRDTIQSQQNQGQ